MIGKLAGAALAAAALVACMPDHGSERPAYRAGDMAGSAASQLACYTGSELEVINVRMVQQVFATATLGCKSPDGRRRFNRSYTNFLGKFQSDLEGNAESLQDLADRKGFSMDTVLTEMANRTAGRANDPGFCSRIERGLDWALSPRVTSLRQVAPPYDFSREMRIVACRDARA